MQTTIPLTDAGIGEIAARIAHQMIRRHSRVALAQGELPGRAFWSSLHATVPVGLVVLDSFLYAYEAYAQKGTRTAQARETFIQRSRIGMTWRRVAEPAYKANRRRADPPPSNRGGQNSLPGFE